MTLHTKVGQIFLEHSKDENYVSIYEETFSRLGRSIQLFAVMEIAGTATSHEIKNKKTEYETLARTIVGAFKKTYVSSPTASEDTFERALSAINSALAKLGGKGKVSWFGKLNAAVCAFSESELCLSTAGNAAVYLARNQNFSALSEGLSEDAGFIKIFANYASGKLQKNDRVILSTKQLFNYLSFDKIRDLLREDDLSEICHEIISRLSDVKDVGFATFIFETSVENGDGTADRAAASAAYRGLHPTKTPANRLQAALRAIGVLSFVLKSLSAMLFALFGLAADLVRRVLGGKSRPRSKKTALLTASLAILLLALSVGFSLWKQSQNQKTEAESSRLTRAEELLNEAEAAAIYQDERRVLSLLSEAQNLLREVKSAKNSPSLEILNERIKNLQDRINKEIAIENPTVLTAFPMIPTDLMRSANGFLALNRNTAVLAFYDFRNGQTQAVLADKNTSALTLGGYIGGAHGYIFINRSGKFSRVDVSSNALSEYQAETPNLAKADQSKIQDWAALGENDNARIYVLDVNQNQIWRFRVASDTAIGPAEPWLKETAALSEARDLAVDNNIYVLFADRLEKYFNGKRQDFNLSAVSPSIQNATRVATSADGQMIYLLEPANERILIYGKSGGLHNQLKSPKLRDAADLYVDEKNKIIYVVSGSELLQVNY